MPGTPVPERAPLHPASRDDGARRDATISTGTPPLDRILGGGFDPGSLIVLAGAPGTGKTILAQQIVFANATLERPALYYTTLSEPHSKLLRHLGSFSWFDHESLGDRVRFMQVTDLAKRSDGRDGLAAVVDEVVDRALEQEPSFVVIDSAKALHHFADRERMRETVYTLASRVSHTGAVLILVGEYVSEEFDDAPEFAVADGILHLVNEPQGAWDRRWLRVLKLRGRDYLSGQHTFVLTRDGIRIHPRLETVAPRVPPARDGRQGFGIDVLDRMTGGGLPNGDATVVTGPTGSGKTLLASHFVGAGLAAGERAMYVSLEETTQELLAKSDQFSIGLREAVEQGRLGIEFVPPMELEIDEVGGRLTERLEQLQPDRVVLDGLGDLIPATRRAGRFPSYLWALMSTLRAGGGSTLFTYEVSTLGGAATRLDALSYLFHNVMVLRYMERGPELGRVLNVLKMRSSAHETGLLPFDVGPEGLTPTGDPGDVDATMGWTVIGHATGE